MLFFTLLIDLVFFFFYIYLFFLPTTLPTAIDFDFHLEIIDMVALSVFGCNWELGYLLPDYIFGIAVCSKLVAVNFNFVNGLISLR